MFKQSKVQISLVFALGLMIVGQVGFVLYHGNPFPSPSEKREENQAALSEPTEMLELAPTQEKSFHVKSVRELDRVFDNSGFDLKKAKSEGKVPRLYLAKLPQDMRNKKKASNKTFVKVLLPHILNVNEKILADRTRLLAMQERLKKGGHLHHSEKMWLSKLAAEYRCKSTKIESLLVHVDVIPPSLALAQATLETGGGRSSAALNKNSPFGYMATKTKVAKFESLLHSVEAYALNLNRHVAYASFRKSRAELRAKNQKLCGHTLASHLTKYSVRGSAYTKDLQNLIHRFDLKSFDHTTLDQNMRVKP